jgi:hypothetical protein
MQQDSAHKEQDGISLPETLSQAAIEADLELSAKETRKIVTPYAFHVSENLIGTRLASPSKRAMAISIDILLIGLLTQASGFLLAGIAAATFFRAGNRLKQKKPFNSIRITLRLLTALLLFVFVMGLFDEINIDIDKLDPTQQLASGANISEGQEVVVQGVVGLALTGKYLLASNKIEQQLAEQSCASWLVCWQGLGESLSMDLAQSGLIQTEALALRDLLLALAEPSLSSEELAQLQQQITQSYLQHLAPTPPEPFITPAQQTPVAEPSTAPTAPSLIDWGKQLLEDLGLGFGWAAFYFSIFTAGLKGQTPGKKLLNIKVIKLDESELNLWDSFGRYGGYGAGFATGLLGFSQVYWDPNRQAIQDKISATLVIDLSYPKVSHGAQNKK